MKISRRIKHIVPKLRLSRVLRAMLAQVNYVKLLDDYLTLRHEDAMLTLRNELGDSDG